MVKTVINKEIFAERLKSLMQENNETLYTIAELLHLSAPTISRYSNAEMAPKITTIEVLANHFLVNPAWLMGLDSSKYISSENSPAPNPINRFQSVASGDQGLEEIVSMLKNRESMLLMFNQVKDLSDNDIKKVLRVIKAIEDEESAE